MLKSGKSVKSLWLGGERFDKYSQDDEDALAKYKKMKAFIGTQVYVRTTDNITDFTIRTDVLPDDYINFTPSPYKDEYVNIDYIRWNGGDSVDLMGDVDIHYRGDLVYPDLCIVRSVDI